MMAPRRERLFMYGRPSDLPQLEWSRVDAHLASAGTYWVVPCGGNHPHPRPVWGVWQDETLYLSIGSPTVGRLLGQHPNVTVHLGSDVDVVVVEGVVDDVSDDARALSAYDEKYTWTYSVEEYGPLTRVVPLTVLAWQSAGWAGRDGFQKAGRWRFGPSTPRP